MHPDAASSIANGGEGGSHPPSLPIVFKIILVKLKSGEILGRRVGWVKQHVY